MTGAIDAYACGPTPMIDAVLPVLQMNGVETRPYLFRQVYAGGAMTAFEVRRKGK